MIFGIGSPKFTGTGTPDSSTVTLDYAVLDPNWNDPRVIEHQSVITGKKTWTTLGDYASFRVTVNLYKYTTSPTPSTKFSTLMTYLHQLVYFYPHKDGVADGDGLGKAIQNSTPANVKFFVSKITPYYLSNTVQKDLIDIEFIAENYVDISQSLQ